MDLTGSLEHLQIRCEESFLDGRSQANTLRHDFARRLQAGVELDGTERLLLNPMAKEFIPPARDGQTSAKCKGSNGFEFAHTLAHERGQQAPRSKSQQKRKTQQQKQLEENIKRTVYICDIDQQVTEEQLASLFKDCGQVVDCRVCGDANSAMRFAFIEFVEEEAVTKAITKNGTVLGSHPLRILQSRTAIVPVNNQFLPRSLQERELCSRTVYAANIDKRLEKDQVQCFFEGLCGKVTKLRLLGDYHHATRIAFVEFATPDSAKTALQISGALLGTLPVRVSPSKTPVRT
eukprot:jgi/Botrbrau1/9560/Bobra.0089s0018.2